jgi:plasmid stabilization system protein ParE
MKNGYKILWTDNALYELEKAIEYLETNWTEKELRNLALNLEKTLNLISQNPFIFQASDEKKEVRRAVVLSLNTLYYRVYKNNVEIVSFFSNRQNPKKRKLK